MEHARFWSLIDGARGDAGALERALARLTPFEIAGFDAWFWAYHIAIDRHDLWAAVYAICGGCSDDGFAYFREWLIGRGQAAVLAAVRDPESLLDVVEGDLPGDGTMIVAARRAYRQVTGEELPDDDPRVEIPGVAEWPADRVAAGAPRTHAFYARTFPKLAHLVG